MFRLLPKKISKTLYIEKSQKDLVYQGFKISFYYALIYILIFSIVFQYIQVYTSSKNLNLLFQLQKRCIRILAGAKYNAHTDTLFYSLNVLPLFELFYQQTAISCIQLSINICSYFFSNKFLKNRENCEYQLRNESDYIIPRINLDYLSIYPSLLNNLPLQLKLIFNKNEFKIELKTVLINKCRDNVCSNH